MLSGETLWAQYSYTLFVMMSECQKPPSSPVIIAKLVPAKAESGNPLLQARHTFSSDQPDCV